MRNRSTIILLLSGILLVAVLSAGCSDDTQTVSNLTTVPTTEAGAKFTTGDIIAKTATSTDTILLIVKYDAATDKYERAFVYKKSDGTYYRKDAKTELSDRAMIEKLYPAKVTHISSLSQVPVITPTTVTTVPTATATTTATTTPPAPTVSSVTPATGAAGTSVAITSIAGTNFRSGATVRLVNITTSTTISGTSVVAESASKITCIFSIPSAAIAGTWNVTVTNSDGKYGTLANGFTITNVTVTTTTTPAPPQISSITPSSAMTGIQVNITNLAGSSLLNTTTVKLTRSGQSDITASNISVVSSSQVTCTFQLTGATTGQWNVLVTNSGGQSGIGTNLFTITPQPPVAAFSANPVTGTAPLAVTFTDQSTNTPTIWSWTFGDGNTSTSQNPTYTYPAAGIYDVSLIASNSGGNNTKTETNYINVSWSTG